MWVLCMQEGVAVGKEEAPTAQDVAPDDASHTIHAVRSVSNVVNEICSYVTCWFAKAVYE